MKKCLRTYFVFMAILVVSSSSVMAQWAQYNANGLPGEDASVSIRDAGSTLIGGTSEIIVDEEDLANKIWKFNVDLDAADKLKYNWFPSYVDPDSEDPVYTPAPMTIASKFKWIDTTYVFGLDMETRGVYKVQAKLVKEAGEFKVRVKDWAADSSYSLPADFDPTVWHVLRLTEKEGAWAVYVDEKPEAFASGSCGKSVGKNLAIIGAFAEKGTAGVLVDWMGLLENEASSPSETALPAGIFTPPITSVSVLEDKIDLNLYPNPTSGSLNISISNELINAKYEVYNITGQIMCDGILPKTQQRLDVSFFEQGMYILKVKNGDVLGAKSFIVR